MSHPYHQDNNRPYRSGTDWGYVLRRLLPGGILCLTGILTWLGVILIAKNLVEMFNSGQIGGNSANGYGQSSSHTQDRAGQVRWQGNTYRQSNADTYTPKTGAYSYTYHQQTDSTTHSDRNRVDAHAERNRQRQEHNEARMREQAERRRAQQEQQRQWQQRHGSNEAHYSTQIPYQGFSTRQPKEGKLLMVFGIILAACFAVPTLSFVLDFFRWQWFSDLMGSAVCSMFLGGSALMAWAGNRKTKMARRYRRYVNLIGRNTQIPLGSLFEAAGVTYRQGCEDLQHMLDKGYLPIGHLDMGRGMLVFGTEGMQFSGFSDFVRESEENLKSAAAEEQGEFAEYQKLVDQLRQRNDRIEHAEMSRKIEMIERTSRRIFDYLRNYPEKKGQLHHFFSYYLPTTLNLLERYAQMEEQNVEGTNINTAKERIEGMMDKVVEGFEKQLDQLFAGTAMDISADVAVLEQMLQKDGLSAGGYTMGI